MWGYSYFSLGFNDTIWYNPNLTPNVKTVRANAHFDGRVDTWSLEFTYPTGVSAVSMVEKIDMRIPYVNCDSDDVILMVTLFTNPLYTTASASTSELGYWYNPSKNYKFESYGSVKWEPGYYSRMFDVGLMFPSGFTGGTIYLDFNLGCSPDTRGNIQPPASGMRSITVVLGNRRGDVNGDDVLNTADVTALTAYVLGNVNDWDQYQIAAADVNGDGYVNVADVTALTSIILNS